MTPATLRRLEWAGLNNYGDPFCPVCRRPQWDKKHAPDCELAAALREAERRETGERPEIRVGDYVLARGPSLGDYGYVDHQPQADYWKEPENAERVVEICRPLWRKEAPAL